MLWLEVCRLFIEWLDYGLPFKLILVKCIDEVFCLYHNGFSINISQIFFLNMLYLPNHYQQKLRQLLLNQSYLISIIIIKYLISILYFLYYSLYALLSSLYIFLTLLLLLLLLLLIVTILNKLYLDSYPVEVVYVVGRIARLCNNIALRTKSNVARILLSELYLQDCLFDGDVFEKMGVEVSIKIDLIE